MTQLRYRSDVLVEDLQIDECTIHRAGNSAGGCWWLLWFRVNRDSDGQPDDFAVPVNPNGSYIAEGAGGKTWGLTRQAPGLWQISPSINVVASRAAHPGEHEETSLWHQTPALIGVPDGEVWISGAP